MLIGRLLSVCRSCVDGIDCVGGVVSADWPGVIHASVARVDVVVAVSCRGDVQAS